MKLDYDRFIHEPFEWDFTVNEDELNPGFSYTHWLSELEKGFVVGTPDSLAIKVGDVTFITGTKETRGDQVELVVRYFYTNPKLEIPLKFYDLSKGIFSVIRKIYHDNNKVKPNTVKFIHNYGENLTPRYCRVFEDNWDFIDFKHKALSELKTFVPASYYLGEKLSEVGQKTILDVSYSLVGYNLYGSFWLVGEKFEAESFELALKNLYCDCAKVLPFTTLNDNFKEVIIPFSRDILTENKKTVVSKEESHDSYVREGVKNWIENNTNLSEDNKTAIKVVSSAILGTFIFLYITSGMKIAITFFFLSLPLIILFRSFVLLMRQAKREIKSRDKKDTSTIDNSKQTVVQSEVVTELSLTKLIELTKDFDEELYNKTVELTRKATKTEKLLEDSILTPHLRRIKEINTKYLPETLQTLVDSSVSLEKEDIEDLVKNTLKTVNTIYSWFESDEISNLIEQRKSKVESQLKFIESVTPEQDYFSVKVDENTLNLTYDVHEEVISTIDNSVPFKIQGRTPRIDSGQDD